MKNIFDLTKREKRLVIVIVVALVAVAFAKHSLEKKSQLLPTSTPASSPTIQTEEEQPDSEDSR
jgi:cell division protein FtsL